MKLVFKITPSSIKKILSAMAEIAKNEHYASFYGDTWTTTGGSRYIFDLEARTLTFIGSRTSFANGAGFGGIYRKDGRYRAYLCGWLSDFECPLIFSKMETSWNDVPGWDDPFCTEAELVWAKEQEQLMEEFEVDCLAIEAGLA